MRASEALIGREAEQAVLAGALERLRSGDGGVVTIESPAGLGKTSLAQWCSARAEAAGTRVLEARADPLRATEPLSVIRQVLPGLAEEPSGPEAAAPPQPGVASGAQYRLTEAAIEGIERRCVDPLLVTVDDLHWADPSSLAVLQAALVLTETQPLLVVATWRPSVDAASIDRFVDRSGPSRHHLRLDPLSDDECLALATRLAGAELGPIIEGLVRRASGSPLLVTELVGGLDSAGFLERDGNRVESTLARPPVSLRDGVARRVRLLGDEVVDVVRAAAVLASNADVTVVAAVLEGDDGEVSRRLETAATAGLLVAEGAGYGFRHDLVREAVYLETPEPRRALLHRRAATVLAHRGHRPAMVAAHLALGAAPGDETAVEWLRTAADEVRMAAPTAALELLDVALGLSSDDAATRLALQRARLDLHTQLGHLDEGTSLARSLLSDTAVVLAPEDRADLAGRAAGLLVLRRQSGEAQAVLDEAIESATTDTAKARLYAQRALAHLVAVDHGAAAADAAEGVRIGELAGDPIATSIALAVGARVRTFDHDYLGALDPGMRAIVVADGDPTGEAHEHLPHFHYALTALDVDDLDAVTHAVAGGRAVAERLGLAYALPFYCGVMASAHYRRGALDDAWVEATTGLSIARDTGSHQASMWCDSFRSLAALHRGELEAARIHAAAAKEAWESDSTPLGVDFMSLSVAGVSAVEGDFDAAYEVLAGSWDVFGALGLHSCQPLLGVELVRHALRQDDEARANDVAATMTEAAARSSLESHRAHAAWAVGLVERDRELVGQATRRCELAGRTLDAAFSAADVARLASAAGDTDATAVLDAAAARLASLGADGTAQRLRDDCSRRPRSSGRTGERFGWESLTPTEAAIVSLVAEGLTNAEIAATRGVSRRTVESHLVRVYTKLGLSSRVQLAVEAAGREHG